MTPGYIYFTYNNNFLIDYSLDYAEKNIIPRISIWSTLPAKSEKQGRNMIITCGQCQSKFKVTPEQIKISGSKVRCSSCQYVFVVYRPQRLNKAATPTAEAQSLEHDQAPPRPPKDKSDCAKTNDDTDFNFSTVVDDSPTDPQSIRKRRNYHRLYSDLAEASSINNNDPFETSPSNSSDGHPPLHHTASPEQEPAETTEDQTEVFKESDDYKGEPEDKNELEDDVPAEINQLSKARLGLASDPAHPSPETVGIDDFPKGFATREGSTTIFVRENSSVRAAIVKIQGQRPRLILTLAIISAMLTIGIYFLSSLPEPLALTTGDEATDSTTPADATNPPADLDPANTKFITFVQKGNLKHFYRINAKEGKLLIITGMVRNSYPEAHCLIRLRGVLLDAGEKILADRFVYAGNIISEPDLVSLPMNEITARLNIRGGQNGINMNIPAGHEIPFMVIFNKLPDNMDEYRIIPVGSSPIQ